MLRSKCQAEKLKYLAASSGDLEVARKTQKQNSYIVFYLSQYYTTWYTAMSELEWACNSHCRLIRLAGDACRLIHLRYEKKKERISVS